MKPTDSMLSTDGELQYSQKRRMFFVVLIIQQVRYWAIPGPLDVLHKALVWEVLSYGFIPFPSELLVTGPTCSLPRAQENDLFGLQLPQSRVATGRAGWQNAGAWNHIPMKQNKTKTFYKF